uniref:Uncharacterized protein n=1 Tax=Aeromonas caviae TaxID=648 RepID=A0A6M4NPY8_AERCA|nr:Hypothetical protein [Aeromonas caviae]QMV81584.1 Hypothetical protein [Aeromonas caviae]
MVDLERMLTLLSRVFIVLSALALLGLWKLAEIAAWIAE